ncbi:MAG TPA: hypothetical protein VEA99_09740, partial [Gemmatimonadaceae bacterium]|nr:hypothetical protein [Gemmatimonadaceae bacterium]
MRRARWWVAAALLALAGVAEGQRGTPPSSTAFDSASWTRVTYVAGRSVYVGAGSARGVREGSALEVVRRGLAVAQLRVTAVSSTRASCEIVRAADSIVVGDSVRLGAAAPASAPATAAREGPDSTPLAPPARRARALGLRGRVGLRYLVLAPRDSGASGFSQPAADLRIEGERVAGSPIGVAIDARTRRTIGVRESIRARSFTQVHQLSLSATSATGGRVVVGRQFSEAFANVSLYDGVSAEMRRARWGVGVFGGTQPSLASFGFSRAVREHGLYVQAHHADGEATRWTATLGGIGSYEGGELNREFAFAQLSLATRRLWLHATQEVDRNRGWKSAAGEAALQPTSSYVSLQVRPWEPLTLHAGFDSRRSVRLWRDVVNPETEFDDRFRQGVWGGASLRLAPWLRLSADARSIGGGDTTGGRTTAATGSLTLGELGPARLAARLRASGHRSPWLAGAVQSAALSGAAWQGRLRVEAEGGSRTERPLAAASGSSSPHEPVRWVGATADLALGRSWFLLLTATREV